MAAAGSQRLSAAIAYASLGAATLLTALAPEPLVFAAIFLFASPVHRLVLPEDVSAAHATGATETPVVLLVLDELPLTSLLNEHGRIDAHRFPNFAALARDATWYRHAFATSSATNYAVPALLIEIRPQRVDLPVASDQPNSIFSLVSRSHVTVVSETVTDMCGECSSPREESTGARLGSLASDLSIAYLHLVAPEDLRRSLPPVDRGWKDFRAGLQRGTPTLRKGTRGPPGRLLPDARPHRRCRAWRQAAVGDGAHPSPSTPWQYLPSGESYQVQGPIVPGLFEDRWARNPWFTEQGAERHLLQVGFVDRLLGRLVRRLRETGLYPSEPRWR